MNENSLQNRMSSIIPGSAIVICIIFVFFFGAISVEGSTREQSSNPSPYLDQETHQNVQTYLSLMNGNISITSLLSLSNRHGLDPAVVLLVGYLNHNTNDLETLFLSEQTLQQKTGIPYTTCEMEGNVSCQLSLLNELIRDCSDVSCPQYTSSDETVRVIQELSCAVSCSQFDMSQEELLSLFSYFKEYLIQEYRLYSAMQASQAAYGQYSYIPEMSTTLSYRHSTIESITAESEALIEMCQDEQNLSSCLQRGIGALNENDSSQRLWYIDRTSIAADLFYDYQVFLDSCIQSFEKGCVCNHSFDNTENMRRYLSSNDISSIIFHHNSASYGTHLTASFGETQYSDRISLPLSMFSSADNVGVSGKELLSEVTVLFDDEGYVNSLSIQGKDGGLRELEQPSVVILKEDDGLVVLTENNRSTDMKTCTLPNRYEQFGVIDFASGILPFRDTRRQQTVFKQPTYEFALFFGDTVPPAVLEDVSISNVNHTSQTILLSFQRPLDDDLAYVQFNAVRTDPSPYGTERFSQTILIPDEIDTLEAINLEEPSLQSDGTPLFEAYVENQLETISLVPSHVYHDRDTDQYLVLIDTIPTGSYRGSLTPIDVSGNRNDTETGMIPFDVRFEMPPHPVEDILYQNSVIRWDPVASLLNGSEYDTIRHPPLDILYEIYCGSSPTEPLDTFTYLGRTQASEYEIPSELVGKYCTVLSIDSLSNSYRKQEELSFVEVI